MEFKIINRGDRCDYKCNTAYLQIDNWNDFSFFTMFFLSFCDETSATHDIGMIKIGFINQKDSEKTSEKIDSNFEKLPDNFFSLGTDSGYYQNIMKLPEKDQSILLTGLNDVVNDDNLFEKVNNENVFRMSLLRDIGTSVVKGQYKRILAKQPPLTNFHFVYSNTNSHNENELTLSFKVKSESTPSTNIHALIGRNGAGKTTIINNLIGAIMENLETKSAIYTNSQKTELLPKDYFSSLVSVSFSAFDSFNKIKDQTDPKKGTCYFYIGLKDNNEDNKIALKPLSLIYKDFAYELSACFSQPERKKRWIRAISTLAVDDNFSEIEPLKLLKIPSKDIEIKAIEYMRNMSSGHAIVLLTITKLVSKVSEKTLVLIDEPETHLHPPLLSAFIRSVSELLHDRNGVAIIATHSPVVIQEIPSTCAWIINRSGNSVNARQPTIETFGENLGTLTREIFGLELNKSGFHKLLMDSANKGGTFNDILDQYENQLGLEAKAILLSLIKNK